MNYCGTFRTYSDYNYRRGGFLSWLKTQHFRKALKLSGHEGFDVAMDFGCADGYFLPTLSAHFWRVYAVDKRKDFLEQCPQQLPNVIFYDSLGIWKCDVIFALETLEHIASSEHLELLRRLKAHLKRGGRIIASVPIMLGPTFLIQRLGLWLTGSHREPMTWRDVFNAAIGRTSKLNWVGGHVGFDHRLLEHDIRAAGLRFTRHRLPFQYVYVIQ